ncbi:MAG: hypothetical protein K2M79_07150 [Muribaculaceae bacterium]|nr:hypothetical protein [Muribaculaceae bacterium]
MELIYAIGFIIVSIFNLIVDNWWIILSLIAIWCLINYIVNHSHQKTKGKNSKSGKAKQQIKVTNTQYGSDNKKPNNFTLIGSRWTAFIGNEVHVLTFETKHGAIFYKASPVTLEIENNESWGIGYNCNANTITFFGSVSIENKSYNFKKGIVEGNKLTVSFETLSENGEWLSGEFYFALVRNNGEYTIIYGDY